MKTNIIFDGNYLIHKTFGIFQTYYRGKDMGEVLSNPENKQVLIRKCIIDMCHTINQLSAGIELNRVIFVFDSRSWRYKYYDNYKYSLIRIKEEWYGEFIDVIDKFESLIKKRGLIATRFDGAEGDDLMYFWVLYFRAYFENERVIVVTGDSDIRQLIRDKISIFNNNSKNMKFYCTENDYKYYEKIYDFELISTDSKKVLIQKALLGDKSDNIPSVKKGFGEVAFNKFFDTLGLSILQYDEMTFSEFCGYISEQLIKFLGKKYDGEDIFERLKFNLQMVWLDDRAYKSIFDKKDYDIFSEKIITLIDSRKDSYYYNKHYTLEDFYGLMIK